MTAEREYADVEAVLAAHRYLPGRPHSFCLCGPVAMGVEEHEAHLAAALAPLLAARERAARAEAAREALAEAADLLAPFSGIGMGSQPTRSEVSDWLRARAASYADEGESRE